MPRKPGKGKAAPAEDPDLDEEQADAPSDDKQDIQDMLQMLKEIQKKKAAKSSARSSAFTTKQSAVFGGARADANALRTDGARALRGMLAQVQAMREQEVDQFQNFQLLRDQFRAQETAAQELVDSTYPQLTKEMADTRAERTEETCKMIERHRQQRSKAPRRAFRNAKGIVEEAIENQKVATDASAYIKGFKTMLLHGQDR